MPMQLALIYIFIVGLGFCDDDSYIGENSNRNLEEEKSMLIFQSLFKQRRNEQIEAVKKILTMKYEDQYKMLLIMFNKTFESALTSKLIIQNSDYTPGFPLYKNDTLRDVLFQLITGTTLYAEFQLKIPEITDHIMAKRNKWSALAKWMIAFTNATGLCDETSAKLLNLVAQETNLIKRSPQYVNPYRKEHVQETLKDMNAQPKKTAPKKAKGPRMVKPRHSEL